MKKIILFLTLSLLMGFTKPHHHRLKTDNICHIFQKNPSWYWKAKKSERKWGVPMAVQMAIINQESQFYAEAKNKHSTAYGFPQALNNTWASYKHSTGAKGRRNQFAAATDFIGWYTHMSKRNLGISQKNSYAVYLAYHEGLGGYKHKSYRRKPGIVRLAKNVKRKAGIYQSQLSVCKIPSPA